MVLPAQQVRIGGCHDERLKQAIGTAIHPRKCGRLAEWFNAPVLKIDGRDERSEGSNPSAPAMNSGSNAGSPRRCDEHSTDKGGRHAFACPGEPTSPGPEGPEMFS